MNRTDCALLVFTWSSRNTRDSGILNPRASNVNKKEHMKTNVLDSLDRLNQGRLSSCENTETKLDIMSFINISKHSLKMASLNDILSDSSEEGLDINSTSEKEECDESLYIFLEF